ncbi:MAG TPA: TrkH family potassium uptake protein [Cyclobacteriaceae bacterium]
MRFNYQLIGNILGILLLLNGSFMLLCIPFSLYYQDGDIWAILISGGITLLFGFVLWFFTRALKSKDLKKKDGYLIVTSGWLIMSFFGMLPYLLTGSIPNITNAFFETLSGFSTTGATILTDIESLNKGILFWRSLTQWIGGMGIIVLTVAILPILGIGGMQLFVAEAPGISPDKLQPRIKETAKRLWYIYLGFTISEIILLLIGGMSFYDAINHGLTTMASGGFSTKNDSIAHFDSPFIQYVIILFMIAAGTNFTISYLGLHGLFKKVLENEEFKYYIGFLIGITIIITITVSAAVGSFSELNFRNSLFQVVSIITTTGYITADYTQWTPFIKLAFFIMMFVGASAGSTAGGVKLVRHIILIKNSFLELKRQLHPSAIIPVRFNGRAVEQNVTFNILAFIMIYISIFAIGSSLMGMLGLDFITAIGSVASCLGNVGPGIGSVGPVDNYNHIPDVGKWFLALLMLIGRLELFTVLILFTPYFWSKY